jgi:hypothetical protein
MRICCAMACDASFFRHAAVAIETILRFPPDPAQAQVEIGFVAINLQPDQRDWLAARGVRLFTDLHELPRFADAPEHAYALTCRPYLPWIMPDYDGYVWVDSDIRFLRPGGLDFFTGALANDAVTITAVQETEAAYCIATEPDKARAYHAGRVQRMAAVYGDEVVRHCQYFTPFNAGLFAARADSPIWERYRRNLGKALDVPFDGMLEQDALNVSLVEVGGWGRAPSVMNWLCSLRMPHRAADGSWRHPDDTARPVFVAHLSNMTTSVMTPEGPRRFFELYRAAGLPA